MLRRLGVVAAAASLVASLLPACTSTANVSDLWTSPDDDGSRRRNVFYTDSKVINCIAELGIGRDDVTLEMYVRIVQVYDFVNDQFIDTNVVTDTLEVHPPKSTAGTPLRQRLTLEPKGLTGQADDKLPFLAGRAQCEAYIDGDLKRTAVFNVDFPGCPAAAITPGSVCIGFYKLGTECNAAGDSGDPKSGKCKCESNGWSCP